jgi:hemolysin activation/secretion protein
MALRRLMTAATVHPRIGRFAVLAARGLVLGFALPLCCGVQAQEPVATLPSFAQLEAEGAKIGQIRILNRNIFNTDDPQEDKALFRWANALHFRTRVGVIERTLLFRSGDPVSVRLIEETERVLRSSRYLYDVQLRPTAVHDGLVDIDVETHDSWTLDPGISAGRSGGANSGGIKLSEYNLLGTGVAVSYSRSTNVDRSSNEFQFSNERAFGGWTSLRYSRAKNSDGSRDAAAVAHPFYALDTNWAAGVSISKDDRIDAIYNAGNVVSQYRHRLNQADVYGGLSQGRVDGWVQRYSIGVSANDDAFAPEPGLLAPAQLPSDEKLVAPYFRYELIEDRFETLRNRNQIERPEFFAVGLAATLQLGRATTGLGSSRNAWLYSGSISRGFEPVPQHILLASATFDGRYSDGQTRRQRVGGQLQYYLPQNKQWLFYASVSGDVVTRPEIPDALLLGGDNGLRGYPLRYQSGDRRTLFTLEERAYTDIYLWRLFRIGAAAYIDIGRAWGGNNVNVANPGWLSDAGFGLRIFSVRSAFSNVLHVDLAFPNDPDISIKRVQFMVKTKTSF